MKWGTFKRAVLRLNCKSRELKLGTKCYSKGEGGLVPSVSDWAMG